MRSYSAVLLFITIFVSTSCDPKKAQEPEGKSQPDALPLPPQEVVQAIQKEFPGAVASSVFADSLFEYLKDHYQIKAKDILVGTSTCVDDIISTKSFHRHSEIKGPFHLGGLAGLPFSGISGLNAFSHHVPEDGAMVLLVGPHIGYSQEKGWGYILRPGQHEASSCCGALVGTLSNLEKGNIKPGIPDQDDYQGGVLSQFTLANSEKILSSANRLTMLTKLTNQEAEAQVKRFLPNVDLQHEHYIVAIGMILINTDYNYVDYVWVTHFKVYDVKNKTFLEDK